MTSRQIQSHCGFIGIPMADFPYALHLQAYLFLTKFTLNSKKKLLEQKGGANE